MNCKAAILIGLLALAQIAPESQTPQISTAISLSGTVEDASRQIRLSSAVVELIDSAGKVVSSATTDEDGRFQILDVQAGRFELVASRLGYLTGRFGSLGPNQPGTPLRLRPGSRPNDLKIFLTHGAVISGFVRTRSGEPIPDAVVVPLLSSMDAIGPPNAGLYRLGASTQKDGSYRIFGLPPGEYFVAAFLPKAVGQSAPGPVRTDGLAQAFYPAGNRAAQASALKVNADESVTGVDLLLDTGAVTITGTIASPFETDLSQAAVLVWAEPRLSPIRPYLALVDKRGTFVIRGLAPGKYALFARLVTKGAAQVSDGTELWGRVQIEADGSESLTIRLPVYLGGTISGEAVAASAVSTTSTKTTARIELRPLDPIPSLVGTLFSDVSNKDRFRIANIPPGRYVIGCSSHAPIGSCHVLQASEDGHLIDTVIEVNGQDARNVSVVASVGETELVGTITEPDGRPTSLPTVLVFPRSLRSIPQEQSWRVAAVRPDAEGYFVIKGLPPGDYLIAVTTELPLEWPRPSALDQLASSAVPVRVAEGSRTQQDLRMK